MVPSKQEGEKHLVCNLCDKIQPITEDIIDSYNFNKEIFHPPGEEFKNLEKIKIGKKKKFKFKE